jgi:hypothetical protein
MNNRTANSIADEWTLTRRVTEEEIEAAKTRKGGWAWRTFREWVVPTPLPQGWKTRLTTFGDEASEASGEHTEAALERVAANASPKLIDGRPFGVEGELDIDPAKLLRKVVSAGISSGHAECLHEFPGVLFCIRFRMPGP